MHVGPGERHDGVDDDDAGSARQLFADIVAAIPVAVHVYRVEDPDDPGALRMIYANPASEAASGLPPKAIIGRTLREIFPPFMATGIPEIYLEVALGGSARSLGDVTYGDDNVEESIFAAQLFPLPGRSVAVAFTDVTKERNADARGLKTLESMTDAFFTFDDDWTLTYLNPQSEDLLRQPPEALVGRNYWDVFPAAAGLKFESEYRRALRDQVMVEFEEYYPPLETWFSVRALPMPSGLAVYFNDITTRRELEIRFAQAQRLEMVGQLAGGIAHDFNNLLTVIDGYTELAQSKLGATAVPAVADLEMVRNASRRASELTGQLLAFSRRQMLHPTVTEVNAIVTAALDLVRPLLGPDVDLERRLDPNAGNAVVDVGQIEQVVLNLAINARDAMSSGGILTVETKRVELETGAIPELDGGSYVTVMVRDEGIGMDPETRRQIFDPFFTTKPVGQGTGLGLSTAYGTIKQSGGHINVETAPGAGTTFTVYLPRTDSPLPAAAGVSTKPHPKGGERVLVVEDEDVVRDLVVQILEAHGYEVVGASGPADALDRCRDGTFDLLVTDVVMPGGDGPTLARAAVERHPRLRVVYMSGYAPPSIDPLRLGETPTAFLAKPFAIDAILATVRELLDRA